MNNCMHYKDYYGSVEYSDKDACFYGKVLGINSLILFEGSSVEELQSAFHMMVDEYLEDCRQSGAEPEKTYKGTFNVRISPELHKSAALCAASEGISLNALVEKAVSFYTRKYFAK